MFAKPLRGAGGEPGDFRVAAFGRFAQLLHRSLHVASGRKDRGQINRARAKSGRRLSACLYAAAASGSSAFSPEDRPKSA